MWQTIIILPGNDCFTGVTYRAEEGKVKVCQPVGQWTAAESQIWGPDVKFRFDLMVERKSLLS